MLRFFEVFLHSHKGFEIFSINFVIKQSIKFLFIILSTFEECSKKRQNVQKIIYIVFCKLRFFDIRAIQYVLIILLKAC